MGSGLTRRLAALGMRGSVPHGSVATTGALPAATLEPARPAPPREVAQGPDRGPGEPDRTARRGRRATPWDALGVALTALAMLGVHGAAASARDTSLGHLAGVGPAATVLAVASLALLAGLVVRDRPRPGDVPRRLAGVWSDPPGAWAAGALGALLAVPVLGLYTPVLLGDADSARVVAAVTHVHGHGINFLVDTQDNYLPHLVLGPAIAVGGLAGAKLAALASLQLLAGVTAYVTYRITRSMPGAAAATLALLAVPAVVDRGGYVPMYPTMLALGYLGGWLAYLAVTRPERPWLPAAGAGVCLALAPEAQPVGVLFLAAPPLVAVLAPGWRAGLAGVARSYLCVAVAAVPRLALNLAAGGVDRLTSYRNDYWITEGYVRRIQSHFWGYIGVDESKRFYLGRLPWRFTHALGPRGYVVLALAAVAWLVFCRGRGRLLVLGVAGVMVVALTAKQVPPFPRYYSPLWPGIAVLVGVGVAGLARQRARAARTLAVAATAALVVLAGRSLDAVVRDHAVERAATVRNPYAALAEAVDDGRGVVGARSHSLVNVTADIPTWGGQFLTEDEFVTYLTWPSDAEVVAVMRRHDIGWVLIHANRVLESEYHDTWLVPSHGERARHVERVAASPRFCLAADIRGVLLYRLGGCPAGP